MTTRTRIRDRRAHTDAGGSAAAAHSTRSKDRGFTLTEVVLSVALLGIMALIVGNYFDSIVGAFGFGSKLASYEREARTAIDRMQRELRAAHSRDTDAPDVADRWPVRSISETSIQFFRLDRSDTGELTAVRYWVDDTDDLLYRSQIEMESTGPGTWQFPGAEDPVEADWNANREVAARYVINEFGTGTDKPLFWNPNSTNDPDDSCGVTETGDGASNPYFQSVHVCLAVDQDEAESPKPFTLEAVASWRNPSSSEGGADDPAALGDFNLFATKTGTTATNGTQTWGASWNCTYYGNGCVRRGDRLEYRIVYGNNFGSKAVEASLSDSLDPNVSFVSATDGGTYSPITHSVTWDGLAFDGGAANAEDVEVVVEIESDAQLGADVLNSATLDVTKYQYGSQIKSTSQSVDSNVTDHTIAVPLPDLSIDVSDSAPGNDYVDVGTTQTYTVTVTNNGDGPATGASIFTRLNYGGNSYSFSTTKRCVSATAGVFLGCDLADTGSSSHPRQWKWDVGTLDPGDSVSATISIAIETGSPWNARGCSSKDVRFQVSSNEENTKTSSNMRWRYRPCNDVRKQRLQSDVSPGGWVEYKIRLRNRYTNTPLTNILIEDDLDGFGNYSWDTTATPQWQSMNGFPVSCSYDGGSNRLNCTLTSFPDSGGGNAGYVDVLEVRLKTTSGASCNVRNRVRANSDLSSSRYSNREYVDVDGGAGCSSNTTTTTTTGGGGTTTTTAPTTTTTTTTTTTRPGGV